MTQAKRTCLITGATRGIGRVAAEEIARAGLRVTLVGRSEERTARAAREIRAATGNEEVDSLLCDLSTVSAVRTLAGEVRERHPKLHVLVNNAGAMFTERRLTHDGFETTFALNHLAYFVLTDELRTVLEAGTPARIVNVASEAHKSGGKTVDLDEVPRREQRFSGWKAYCQSKLLNILFTKELARRVEGTGVTANCLHPGFVRTGFGKNNGLLMRIGVTISALLFGRSPSKGARGIVHLATSPAVADSSGGYYMDHRELRPSKLARDEQLQRELWERTEALLKALES